MDSFVFAMIMLEIYMSYLCVLIIAIMFMLVFVDYTLMSTPQTLPATTVHSCRVYQLFCIGIGI